MLCVMLFSHKNSNVSSNITTQAPLGKKTLTTWAIWLPPRKKHTADAQKAKSQDLNHKWISLPTLSLSLFLNFLTQLTGAQKALFQLLKTKAHADHAGHSRPQQLLNHTQPLILGFSLICLLNRSLHVLLTPTSAEVLVIVLVQPQRSLLTTLLKVREFLKSSNTLIPHTTVLKAHVQYLLAKPQKYKSQALLN